MSTRSRRVILLMVVVAALATLLCWGMVRHGFSAREKPSWLEASVARTARGLAVPAAMKDAQNPLQPAPEVLAEARAHFADHCASCHGNDGSGRTEMGRNMYPKVPDMRLPATQNLTDGEIYSIIHNGIRLTGMPAWGSTDKDDDSWKLVLFIRHLPKLTPDELKEMERFNPVSRAELEQEREAEDFLAGQDSSGEQQKASKHKTH